VVEPTRPLAPHRWVLTPSNLRVTDSCSVTFDAEQDTHARRLLDLLGVHACSELLEVLERSEDDRASLIGRLGQRPGAGQLADLLIEIEADSDGITRLRTIDALRRALAEK
jgi:hypothetical protein